MEHAYGLGRQNLDPRSRRAEYAPTSLKTHGSREQRLIFFDTHPDRYRHWKLAIDGAIATLKLDVDEEGGLAPGYKLKLNSYDLGVDIELHDALNRIRFEHPAVKTVVLTSAKERMFCAGANIYMLGSSSHAFKVNFCKFTNETRNGMEDSSRNEGLKFLAAVNGACAGGGYEVALACDEILMIDDRSSTVSLPEVALLGVLPGTGGLSRLIDKRKVRRDLADVFCTTSEGVRAARAKDWNLVDAVALPQRFAAALTERALALAATSDRAGDAKGVALQPLARQIDETGYRYPHLNVEFDRVLRTASLTITGPDKTTERAEAMLAQGAAWWPLALARELDDAILLLRLNEPTLGTLVLKTCGSVEAMLASDRAMLATRDHWFVRETLGFLRRTLSRLDLSAKSLIAVIEPGSCFAGTLLEVALASDRSYMLDLGPGGNEAPCLALGEANFGLFPMANGLSRLINRFCGETAAAEIAATRKGELLDAATSASLGLVTATPDALDWEEEIRLVIEERSHLSPDALTALEANLRFAAPETMATRIFGRLSAWQNWIFTRPNATGAEGALKRFGTGARPRFDWERV